MKTKYIAFVFIFAIALIVGTMIDGQKKPVEPISIADPVSKPVPDDLIFITSEPIPENTPMPPQGSIDPGNPPTAPTAQQPTLSADYLFTDDFDHNFKSDWRAIDGEFMTIDNWFAPTGGVPARIVVGSHDWRNYKVDGIFRRRHWSASITLGIRSSEDGAQGYFFRFGSEKAYCSKKSFGNEPLLLKEGSYTSIFSSYDYDFSFTIQAQDDRLTLLVDGNEICTFTDASISSGVFYVEFYPGDGKYPYIDDIRIRGL